VIPAVRDHIERRSGQGHFGWRGNSQQRTKVRQILWTRDIVPGEDLQRDQMPCPGDADREFRQQFERLCVSDHLALDP
jgi:hypothetical protein